jgi:hypothetical protein
MMKGWSNTPSLGTFGPVGSRITPKKLVIDRREPLGQRVVLNKIHDRGRALLHGL